MTWLTGYAYRKKTTITGQTGAGTNYQIKLQIGNVSGGDFNLSGHALNFPNDIRFTNSDGFTQLYYWIENIATAPITVWIKVTADLGTNVDIYCYYGKTSDTAASDGTNTFQFFDDFADNKYTGRTNPSYPTWSVITGTWSASGGYLSAGSGVPEITVPQTTAYGVYEWKFMRNGTTADHSHTNFIRDVSGNAYNLLYNNSPGWSTVGFWWSDLLWAQSLTLNQWYDIKITRDTSGVFNFYIDGVLKATRTDNTYTTCALLRLQEGGSNSNWDNFRVRKYAPTEPAFSAVGSEQTPPNITATSMTITKSENPCRTGICTVTVVVRYSNSGGADDSISPNITIDTIPQTAHADRNVVAGSYIDETFTLSGLSPGTHNICPVPN